MSTSARSLRLGKRELGPYAFEWRMPQVLGDYLEDEGPENEFRSVISHLARFIENDKNVERAYLCHESAVQVQKLKYEGRCFCGYRNMQMLLLALSADQEFTYIKQKDRDGQLYDRKIHITAKPRIFQLQNMIEDGWDRGINPDAARQMGKILGSRKYVGTPEAETFFLRLNIPCTGHSFTGLLTTVRLLNFVEEHFRASNPSGAAEPGQRIVQTTAYPIYLQREGHSITVVGLERTKSGDRRLLVFDPGFPLPARMVRLVDKSDYGEHIDESEYRGWAARCLLLAYRKTEWHLRRFNRFEALTIDPREDSREDSTHVEEERTEDSMHKKEERSEDSTHVEEERTEHSAHKKEEQTEHSTHIDVEEGRTVRATP